MTQASFVVRLFVLLTVTSHTFAASARAQPPRPERALEASIVSGVNRGLSLHDIFGERLIAEDVVRDLRVTEQPSQWFVGFNVAANPIRFLMLGGEFLYDGLGDSRLSGTRVGAIARETFTRRARGYEATFAVRLQFPAGTWRVQPHFGGGVGSIRAELKDGEVLGRRVEQVEIIELIHYYGVGARLFVTRSFGLAPEFRFVRLRESSFPRLVTNVVFRVE